MILSIDTSDNLKTVVRLDKKKIVKKYQHPREQEVLGLIDQIIKEAKISHKQIKKIRINTGPGSFTGLRVGLAVANAMAWCQDIKVNGKKIVFPKYK